MMKTCFEDSFTSQGRRNQTLRLPLLSARDRSRRRRVQPVRAGCTPAPQTGAEIPMTRLARHLFQHGLAGLGRPRVASVRHSTSAKNDDADAPGVSGADAQCRCHYPRTKAPATSKRQPPAAKIAQRRGRALPIVLTRDSVTSGLCPGATMAIGVRPRAVSSSATRAKFSVAHCLVSKAAVG